MRLKSLLLAGLMLLFSALPALAATLTLGTVSGTPGQNVTVPITLTNSGASIAAVGIDIGYDPAKLTPIAIAPATKPGVIGAAGTAAGKMLIQNQVSAGLYRIGVTSLTDTNLIGDGVVATISFAVAAGTSGNVALTNTASASDASGTAVTITGVNGQITLPVIPPSITAFTLPATGTSLTVPFTTLTASANTAAYLISDTAATPLASDARWTTTKPTSFTFTTYGAKTLWAWAKDSGTTISTAGVSASTTLTAPLASVTAFVIPTNVYSTTIPITTFTASNAVAYLITESATAPAASAITATTAPATFTVTGFTAHTLYAWVKNAAGVVSVPFAGQTVTVSEKPAPLLTITAPVNNAITGDSTVEVKGTATKNPAAGSGNIAGVTVNGAAATLETSGAFSKTVTLTEGANTITVVASDDQNPAVTATQSITVISDKTKPTLVVSAPTAGLRTKGPLVTVSGTVADANGIDLLTVNGTATTVTNGTYSYALTLAAPEGEKEIKVEATDKAGNKESITRTIIYDITPLTLTVTEPADAMITKAANVTVAGTVTGAAEGETVTVGLKNGATTAPATVTGTAYTGSIALTEGSNALVVTATDLAGNKTEKTLTVTRDSLSPALAITDPSHDIQLKTLTYTIKGTVDDATPPATVTLTFNGATFTPAVANKQFSQAITFPAEGQFQVVVTATDTTGNPASTTTRNIIYTPYPADSNGDGQTTSIEEVYKAFRSTLGLVTLTATEKLRLDCAPLGADGKPQPNGVVDGADVILLLRKVAGLVSW